MDKQTLDKKLSKIKNFVLIRSGFNPSDIFIDVEASQYNDGSVDIVRIGMEIKVQSDPDMISIGKKLVALDKKLTSIFDTWGFDSNLEFNRKGISRQDLVPLVDSVNFSLEDEILVVNFGFLIYLDE